MVSLCNSIHETNNEFWKVTNANFLLSWSNFILEAFHHRRWNTCPFYLLTFVLCFIYPCKSGRSLIFLVSMRANLPFFLSCYLVLWQSYFNIYLKLQYRIVSEVISKNIAFKIDFIGKSGCLFIFFFLLAWVQICYFFDLLVRA